MTAPNHAAGCALPQPRVGSGSAEQFELRRRLRSGAASASAWSPPMTDDLTTNEVLHVLERIQR